MIKKIIVTVGLIASTLFFSGYVKPDVYNIDAEKNAINHNNVGLNAMQDGRIYEAIQEFHLAIALNPKTQATAVYYNNLGDAYMKAGYFAEAQRCYERAIVQYSLNFMYYQNLVKSFKAQNLLSKKIPLYKQKAEKNPMSMIILGLLYIESGNKRSGIIKLDEFCMQEPNLLITGAVRNYIQQVLAQ